MWKAKFDLQILEHIVNFSDNWSKFESEVNFGIAFQVLLNGLAKEFFIVNYSSAEAQQLTFAMLESDCGASSEVRALRVDELQK